MNTELFFDENFYKIGFIGTLTGIVASFIGGGAEILIVPLLVYLKVISDYKTAIGTSLASLLLPIGIFAVFFYMRQKCTNNKSCVNWPYALLLGFFFTLGTLVSYFTSEFENSFLKKLFAISIILIGVFILIDN